MKKVAGETRPRARCCGWSLTIAVRKILFAGIGYSSQQDALFIERLNYRETGSGGATCKAREAPLELLALTYEYYKQGDPPEHFIVDYLEIL